MNFVAAAFVAASPSQSEAYRRFKRFVGSIRDLWTPGFPLLQTGTVCFENLVDDRPWYTHMCSLDVSTGMYLPQAWLTSFAAWMPLETLSTCLELLEFHGLAGVVALTISILDRCEHKILHENSMDGILHVLRSLKSQPKNPKDLKMMAKAELPSVYAMLAKPRERSAANRDDKVCLEVQQSEEEKGFTAWSSSGSKMLQRAEESIAASQALFQWAMGETETCSTRTIQVTQPRTRYLI
jgi:hypothetical protein